MVRKIRGRAFLLPWYIDHDTLLVVYAALNKIIILKTHFRLSRPIFTYFKITVSITCMDLTGKRMCWKQDIN